MNISFPRVIALSLLACASSACARTPAAPAAPDNAAAAQSRIPTVSVPPAASRLPDVPAAPMQIAALNPEYELFFNQAVALINQHRASRKLSALTRDNRLDAIAAAHSRYMAAKDDLSHVGFNDRFQQANMHSCAENVAWNQITASELVEDWIASPVHDKNLLKPNASLVGMGRAKGYTTYFACQP